MKNLGIIKKNLTQRNYKLAIAESLSSGNIQAKIGSISEASSFFEGGLTVYSIEQKVKILKIDKAHAVQVNCVSKRVAKEMAMGVCQVFNTEIGISTTGYIEPYAAMQIENAFAYFCVWNNVTQRIILENRVNLSEDSRIANQKFLTETVIVQLAECLRKDKKIVFKPVITT
jgi:nicotinamide-nucleotide amidase